MLYGCFPTACRDQCPTYGGDRRCRCPGSRSSLRPRWSPRSSPRWSSSRGASGRCCDGSVVGPACWMGSGGCGPFSSFAGCRRPRSSRDRRGRPLTTPT